MRLLTRLMVVLFVGVASVGGATTSVSAQENVTLPTLAELRSVEFNFIGKFNDLAAQVCRFRASGPQHIYSVCHDLITAQYPELDVDLVEGRVREAVVYDDKVYVRVNDEQTWSVTENESYDPNQTLNGVLFSGYSAPSDAVITNVGRTTVNGAAATQFQFWSTNAELNAARGGQYVYDVFVSDQQYILKDQASSRGTFPLGEGVIEQIWTYSNFNGDITVSPPPAESVRAASIPSSPIGSVFRLSFPIR